MLSRNQSFRESRVTSSERRSAPQRSQSFSIKSRRTLPSEHSRIERSHTEQKTIRQDQPSNNVTSKMLAELNSEHHLIPNYFTMTNRVLKQKFSQVDNDVHFLRRWFDTSEKCATVRQYAQLSAHYYHATYQRELWKVYYDASLTFSVWPRTTVKEAMALHTDLNSFFFLSSAQLYAQHQEQAAHYKRRQRSLDEFERQEEYRQADQLIHLARLFEHVKRLVVHDLHRVRVTFEQKINLFHYDADDYRAVAAFYHSNPTKDQIQSAQAIWQWTHLLLQEEERIALCKERLPSWRSVTRADPFQRTSWLAQSLQKIVRWKHFRLVHSVEKGRMAIRTYQEHIDAEKYKLLDGLPLCPLFSSECLLNEIEKRQQNLTNRMIYAIQCQMPSFIRHTAPERGLAIERDPTDFSLTSRFE